MRHPHASRTRALRPLAVGVACLCLAVVPAASLANEEQVLGTDGGIELAPIDSIADGPATGAPADATATVTEPAQPQPEADPFATGTPDTPVDDLDGPADELRALRASLDAERVVAQRELIRLESGRERAEQRLERATEAIAARLVELFEAGQDARLQALILVRDTTDAEDRAELVATLDPRERALVVELDAATDAAGALGSDADAARLQVLSLGTRVAAINAALDQRRPMSADERARATGARWSVDADMVFATGPIPSIGYWGEMAGGSVLDGWMGFAGAAVGGVGCEPPDPSYVATGSIEQGEASWYGPGFHGNNTANGEVYDQRAMTAAHKTLPFGTVVRVYSSATARCAFVRINDRGPYVDGRIIDLSEAAAEKIGMTGVAPVQVEVWAAPGGAPAAA